MSFELPELDYSHDALEPHIDTRTMEIHHGKHHSGYTAKLNAALEGTDKSNQSIDEIMLSLDSQNISLPNIAGTKSCAKNWSETIDQTIKGCVYCNTVCPVYQNQLHNLYVIL